MTRNKLIRSTMSYLPSLMKYMVLPIVGNMYVIAIPIRDAKKMFYASHAFGVPCNELTPDDHRKKLSASQREKYVQGLYSKCSSNDQYRVAAGLLSSQHHEIFLLSGIKNKKEFKVRIKDIAKKVMEMRTYSTS